MNLETLIESVVRGDVDLAEWASELPWAEAAKLRDRATQALERLPVPIRAAVDSPEVRRRRALERILGHLLEREGDHRLLTRAERVAWLRGGRHVDYLRVLDRAGRPREAAGLARTLLSRDGCTERDELERFLASLSKPPADWEERVASLAEEPTVDAWDDLLRFTSGELRAERIRYTVDLLLGLDVSADQVFRLAAREGTTSEIITLIESGQVDPRVIEAHADGEPVTRSTWLGLAARAACVSGDRLGTLRLLRRAHSGGSAVHAEADLAFIADHGDPALHDMLVKAGVELGDD